MIFWCKKGKNRLDSFVAKRKFFGVEQYFHPQGGQGVQLPRLQGGGGQEERTGAQVAETLTSGF